jgi:hypothetical protein
VQQKVLLLSVGVSAAALLAGCQPSRDDLVAEANATIKTYCTDCHNDIDRTAGMTMDSADVSQASANPEKWEKVIRKLRAGMMPPSDGPRPDADAHAELVSFLESELDRTSKPYYPAPGLHRLNRAEYSNAIRDLIALDVDATKFLPPDDSSRGFDNQAGSLGLSPALLEAYLSAAGRLSRIAIGDESAPTQEMYRVPEDETQNYHVEGLPFGTRGGILIDHDFPVDGRYTFKVYPVTLGNMGSFRPFGEVPGEQLEVLLDGKRVAIFDWDKEYQGFGGGDGKLKTLDVDLEVPAGRHAVGVTFLATNFAPLLDLNKAFERSTIETGGLPGFTFYPHVGSVRIDGPYDGEGAKETAARRKIFVCYPESSDQELPCAKKIVSSLVRRAYRGMQTDDDIQMLMGFYEQGHEHGSFDTGIEMVLHRILADPKFLYRAEEVPDDVVPGDSYHITDLELASRLSFFLWSSIPDDELLEVAEEGRLRQPDVLEAQVRRMLDDPRSFALTENFAGQWLQLRNLDSFEPTPASYPNFDNNLREAYRKETELFFDSLIREDHPVTDLLTADYTFVNERLAKEYGIPGVKGSRFRRVALGDELDARRGLLGKGSLLAVTSQPVRTSPVIRGHWVLEQLLGSPPPPPPPNVPPLKAAPKDPNAPEPSMREKMVEHRANPACSGCHSLMDPIGFALEPFDAIGTMRTHDEHGNKIDPVAVTYDGTQVDGVTGLRDFVLKHKDQFVRVVVEKLMTYALGRGVEYYDMPVIRSIVRDASQDDYRMRTLILDVAKSAPFEMNTKADPKAEGQLASAE